MARKFQAEANEILGRPLNLGFNEAKGAQEVVKRHKELVESGLEDWYASEVIVAIWNAALDESED